MAIQRVYLNHYSHPREIQHQSAQYSYRARLPTPVHQTEMRLFRFESTSNESSLLNVRKCWALLASLQHACTPHLTKRERDCHVVCESSFRVRPSGTVSDCPASPSVALSQCLSQRTDWSSTNQVRHVDYLDARACCRCLVRNFARRYVLRTESRELLIAGAYAGVQLKTHHESSDRPYIAIDSSLVDSATSEPTRYCNPRWRDGELRSTL